MLISVCIPVVQEITQQQRYLLDSSTIRLVGKTTPALTKKFTYDSQNNQWQFNKEGITAAAPSTSSGTGPDFAAAMQLAKAQSKMQIGGANSKAKSLYSVNLPADGSKGITYYDTNTNLSFSMVPQFKVTSGQDRNGQLIYPFQDGGKLVYTAKNNGMKEDIVLSHNIGDSLHFSYKLQLPKTLEVKILNDGAVGVYSADPVLFGNISYGSDMDKAKLESARQTAPKDHLVFVIPPPLIKQTGPGTPNATASFNLDGNELYLNASGLAGLHYPVSIDPSVVITSASDFTSGNNEGNIDYPSGQINRGGLTGGTVQAWNYTHGSTNDGATFVAGFTNGRNSHTTVAYNGYLYVLGGNSASGFVNDVQYAPINANGTIGTWNSTTSFTNPRGNHTAVAYNGYLYVVGGTNSSTYYNDVQYAPINANGTIGTWNYTHNSTNDGATFVAGFTNPRYLHTTIAYNGYLYVIGGYNGTTFGDVQYAPINTDGTVGTWNSTTSFTNPRYGHTTVVYNGYIYIIDGFTTGVVNDVEYAPINANGTVGTWNSTTSFTNARYLHTTVVYNGYLYTLGGNDNGGTSFYNDVQYSAISPAGSTPTWKSTAGLPNETAAGKSYNFRSGATAAVYDGYLYVLGGYTAQPATHYYNSVVYTHLNADGTNGGWSTATAFSTARVGHSTVVYNGYLYVIGGYTGSLRSDVQYAQINASTGNVGAWTTTTALPVAMDNQTSVVYNGYVYVIGGHTTTYLNSVLYAPLSSTGTVGAWHYTHNSTDDGATFVGGFTNAREDHASTLFGNYVYILGGDAGSTYYNDVQYAPINANGTVGTWSYTHNSTNDGTTFVAGFNTPRNGNIALVYNGYLYVAAGSNGTSYYNDVQYAPINANGTVGTWASTTSFGTAGRRYPAATAVYRGNMYFIGGDSGSTYYGDVFYEPINNGGTGTNNAWSYTHNSTNDGTTFVAGFTNGRYGHVVIAYNGYLYVLGGWNGGGVNYNDVQYAPINANGTVGTWSYTHNSTNDGATFVAGFTNARNSLTAVAYNGYMYIMGGDAASAYNDVQYAPINANGTIGTWNYTHNSTNDGATFVAGFTNARFNHTSVVYNGYLYVIGGYNGTTYYNDVQYAPINANGTVGTWNYTHNSTNDGATFVAGFTNARYGHTSVVYNGYLYVIGGYNGTTYYNDVQYAPINTDGTIGTWQTTTSIAKGRYLFAAFAYNGYLYIEGGDGSLGAGLYNDVQYASINPSGTLSDWATSAAAINTSHYGPAGAQYEGNIYILGGSNASTTMYNDVQYASLNTVPRTGMYSKLVDFGATVTPSSITYTGLLSNGAKSILYSTAGTNGVLGSASTSDTLTVSGPQCIVGGGGTVRYMWLTVTMDDSMNAVFPDVAGTNNDYVTDITVSYLGNRAPPNLRLHGGKFFQNEVQQPLDTCGP